MELRVALPEDLPFLFKLYRDVRGPEVSAWGLPAGQVEVFLHMQFDAQRRSYEASFPQAIHQIVISNGEPVGRRIFAHTADGIHLVDIALLASHRNHGLGTLHVLRGNPALRLYQRLGFEETAADAMYIQMAWKPGSEAPSARQVG